MPMPLRRRVGQVLIGSFTGHAVPVELTALAREFDLGGVTLFARNVESPEQVLEVALTVEALGVGAPAWVSVDQEGGRVARLKTPFTVWPPAATLGRAASPELATRFARALARELRAVGVTLDFAPVLDVLTNAANPAIGDRALSDDATRTAALGAAIITALQAEGVAACGKHFPGHGDTSVDSHLELPLVEHGPDRLRGVEWVPFRAALVALAYAALVIVPFGRINLRYLMPAVPALAVGVAAALEGAGDLMVTRMSAGMRRALWSASLLLALLPLSGTLRQRFLSGHVVLLRHAFGQASAQEVWRRHPDGTARDFSPVIANVQRLVPKDGKVLLLWEARGLPFEREVLVDAMLSNWSFLAQSPATGTCLAGTGITHLLVGAGSVEYYVNRGADPRVFMLDRFARFRERCLGPNTTIGPGVELFPLRAPTR